MPRQATQQDSGTQLAEPIRVFWQPGCSSCVKVKEFLTSLGVDFVSVNILDDPKYMDELLAFGIRSVPVLVQGKRTVFAQNLDDVAKFVGRDRGNVQRLAPEVLIERWLLLLHAARELITKIPADKLEMRPVPERPRTMRELSYHIFQIPESVLESVENGLVNTLTVTNVKYDHIRTTDDLLAYADRIIERLERWQAKVDPAWFRSTMETYYGKQPAMQVLERGTWHSGQHVRQLDLVVSELTGAPKVVPPRTYDGLPMPAGIWE